MLIKPESARTLAWTAGILNVLALAVISPTGAFALFVLAAICAVIPTAFATKKLRIISAVLLIISIALAVNYFPEFKRDQEAYTQRVKERAADSQVATPENQDLK